MKSKILLVEDEESLQGLLRLNLELEGYDVSLQDKGDEALVEAETSAYSLIVLDVMIPNMDGFTVCEKLRAKSNKTPILFLTAKGSDQDRIKGLKIGGDDYLVKPFNLEEFLLRVKKLVLIGDGLAKRNKTSVQIGHATVNFDTYELIDAEEEVKRLTDKEIKLLKLLVDNEGRVVSRDEILNRVWGYDNYPTTRTVDNFILAFRKYFESDPKTPDFFHSIRGVGYKYTSGKK